MRFLRSVKGYTKLDKIRSEVMRKELEILFIYHPKYLLMTSFPGPDAFLRNLFLKLIISYVSSFSFYVIQGDPREHDIF
jgi:hypothetical protein